MADKKISQLTGATVPLAGTEEVPLVQSSTTKKVTVSDLTAGRAVTALSLTAGATPVYGVTFPVAGDVGFPKQSSGASYPFAFDHEAVAYGQMRLMSSTTSSNTLNKTILAFNQNGDVNLSAGNLIQGTAAKGVNFTANTPAAGMTSQLLNWYEEGTWTPVVAGSSTAGTYELASYNATYTRIGRQVTLICYVRLAAAITGGGSGSLTITGIPFAKSSGPYPVGSVIFDGVDWTAGANLCSSFATVSASSTIYFEQTNDNAGATSVPISGVAANDYIFFSITYWA